MSSSPIPRSETDRAAGVKRLQDAVAQRKQTRERPQDGTGTHGETSPRPDEVTPVAQQMTVAERAAFPDTPEQDSPGRKR